MNRTKKTWFTKTLLLASVAVTSGQYAPPPPPGPFQGFLNEWLRKDDPYMNAWDFGGEFLHARFEVSVRDELRVLARDEQNVAETLRRELEKRYGPVSVQTFQSDRTFYRVRVGRESNEQSAQKLADELRKAKLKGFVVRLN